jgi:hypothetical protein
MTEREAFEAWSKAYDWSRGMGEALWAAWQARASKPEPEQPENDEYERGYAHGLQDASKPEPAQPIEICPYCKGRGEHFADCKPAQEPVSANAVAAALMQLRQAALIDDWHTFDAIIRETQSMLAAPLSDKAKQDRINAELLGMVVLLEALRSKGAITYNYIESRSGSMVYVDGAIRSARAALEAELRKP